MPDVSTAPHRAIIDGCTAAAYIAYALSDAATVYPITPVASMGDTAAKWAMQGRKNVFGHPMKIMEMESELGAAGATHGTLSAGVPSTTFTASQGLLLMIPNMYKIAGELLPAVFHVGARSLATHALSIFGDHQDVMATRSTGFTFLVSNNVQETVDLALVAHLAALEGSLPVLHMFDGWRTGNEMSTVELPGYDQIAALTPMDAIDRLRSRGMNPETPNIRGTAQNPDVYFQNREAANRFYDEFPAIVEKYLQKVGDLTGRRYRLFDYVGAPDAEKVLIAMGSVCDTIAETVSHLNRTAGARLGVIKVRLYRPFRADRLLGAIPPTAKAIAVLDRTKEPGAQGEPLYLDICTAFRAAGRDAKIIGGRYGLSSKDFTPTMVKAVIDAMDSLPAGQQFTVGITDDVTRLSLPLGPELETLPPTQRRFQFYGMGSDGTVGATRQAAQILSDLSGQHVQAFFEYSAKKSGGYTVSSLRMDSERITSEYEISKADYIGINKERYLYLFDIASRLKQGSLLVINTAKDSAALQAEMPAELRRTIAGLGVKVFTVNAEAIARKNSLGVRINTIMEAVFLQLCGMVDCSKSLSALKEIVKKEYIHEGTDVVSNNLAAIDAAIGAIREISVPAPTDSDQAAPSSAPTVAQTPLQKFVETIAGPCLLRRGDTIPVSGLSPDGFCPVGESAYEKRTIALNIPQWTASKCIECTLCSLVCAHAAIRPVILSETEAKEAGFDTIPAKGIDGMQWRIQVYPQDCTGCGSCATICPGRALEMLPIGPQLAEQKANLEFTRARVTDKCGLLPRFSVKGSQLRKPLLEFSGACGGCGETPYVKLLTQLFGERMVIANATGCSSVWGADFPSMPYCAGADGRGPAWGNSLFEDNAEYGLGIALGLQRRREATIARIRALATESSIADDLRQVLTAFLASPDDAAAAERLKPLLPAGFDADLLVKPSVWAIGGDGWAYDIGYAGLDHVISQNIDINLLVMDTECYSNTGGQMSKATPLGAIAKYAPDGKRTVKKDLGRIAMTYGHVYVGCISLTANPMQAIEVMKEAEAYPGPSLIIAYCPCINHGIRAGMSHAATEMREAVKSGYWPLWHYNPLSAQPLTVDSPAADGNLPAYLDGENRYADLDRIDPKAAAELRQALAKRLETVYDILKNTSGK